MSRRLVRLLSAGGCCVQRTDGDWSVYRSRDLRKSIIGILPMARVNELELSGELVGEAHRGVTRLVWSKPSPARQSSATQHNALSNQTAIRRPRRSLFERTMSKITSPSHRRTVAQVVADWNRDVARAEQAIAPAGMNWKAVETGTRIDRQYQNFRRADNYSGAIRRVDDVRARFTKAEYALIEDMLLARRSRNAIALRSGQTIASVEVDAANLLQRLVEVYMR